jgi:hypothetical protein
MSVKYRKSKNVSIGIPPFSTVQDGSGALVRSPQGAWLQPDGTFVAGTAGEDAPHSDTKWRGFADCAEAILKPYRENQRGDVLNRQDWAFRDRWNQLRATSGDDVRRVVSNWREYAGLIGGVLLAEGLARAADCLLEGSSI